jgi:hypothetical protein
MKRIVLLLVLSLTFAHAQDRPTKERRIERTTANQRTVIPDETGPRDLVEVQQFIEREAASSIDPTVPRTRRAAVVAAATSSPLCTVTRVLQGPLPGGNVELILDAGGVLYTFPVSDPKKREIKATWLKVPCNFDQKKARIGRRGTWSTTFNVQPCRCGKLSSGKCKKVTKGCKP